MTAAFDPLQLTKEASLNRTVLADLPGADPRLTGRRAYDVLRLEALETLAADHGLAAAQRTDIPRRLQAALRSADPAEVAQAQRVLAEVGRRLGHLVATLRLGDAQASWLGNERASPWRTAYRRHWQAVDRIWLAGGIVAALGADLLQPARTEAQRLGVAEARLDPAPHADVLALIGAARTRAAPAPSSMVFDFGYSSVKRGLAGFQRGALHRLDVLPGFAIGRPGLGLDSQSTSAEVMHAVVDVVRTTFQEARRDGSQPDAEVMVSLATYVQNGRPDASPLLYDRLSEVDFDALTAELARATGVPLQVRFVHDGTSAAAALQPDGRQAIIVMGTSLGAGFTVPDQRRLPIAADLQVHYRSR